MQIYVFSRDEVESGVVIRDGAYMLISIRDPDKRPVKICKSSGLLSKLELAFHDAEPSGGAVTPGIVLMSDDHAEQLRDFVMQHRASCKAIVVHCEQGMSRSPAVAAAIAKSLGIDSNRFWLEHQPNQYVYEVTLEAFEYQ